VANGEGGKDIFSRARVLVAVVIKMSFGEPILLVHPFLCRYDVDRKIPSQAKFLATRSRTIPVLQLTNRKNVNTERKLSLSSVFISSNQHYSQHKENDFFEINETVSNLI